MHYLLTSRSLTGAQLFSGALERAGIPTVIMNTPQELSEMGCGYCVKVSGRYIFDALAVLRSAGREPVHVYVQYADGSFSEARL